MNFDTKKTVFLIDGSSFLYRAYYGLKPMYTIHGQPVQAIFSFCRMIKKLITTFHPSYMALVWDSKGKTTRHETYPEYKATRQAPPSDLFEQKEKVLEFADLIGLKQIAKEGIEADDLIYSVAQEQSDANTIVIISSDKDMVQAVDNNIVIFDPFKDRLLDRQLAQEELGFPVERLSLFYGLVGDASDNIPGVTGIGKKSAHDIAKEFSTMEAVYENLNSSLISPRVKRALEADKDHAFLSRDLFLLQKIPLAIAKEELFFDETKWSQARPLFEELQFRSLVAELDKESDGQISVEAKLENLRKYNFITVTSAEQLEQLCDCLITAKIFALDTEGTGLLPLEGEVVGISFCMEESTAYYVPFGHVTGEQQLTRQEVFDVLKPILEDPQYKKYLHNAKFDYLALYAEGVILRGLRCDTMIAAQLLGKEWQRVGLKYLSEYYFNEPVPSYKEMVIDAGYKQFSQVPLDRASLYAASDAHQTWRLAKLFEPMLIKERMDQLYYTLELPLVQILCDMESTGILLDVSVLKNLNISVEKDIGLLEEQIRGFWEPSRGELNINSRLQMQTLLFDILGLPVRKKSAKGGASTDQEVLAELAKLHPAPSLIVRYRELFKLKSTYIDALPTYINKRTGRIHTSYNQAAVTTGRLSSSEPNLQNIPADISGYGIEIRAAFKPNMGDLFLSADYSQIELRVLAHLSQDTALLQSFLSGQDIHAQTAARLFDVAVDLVTYEQRQLGKRINFSILYGLTPYGLSKDLDIALTDAKNYIYKYFAEYPRVKEWMEEVVRFTEQHGYVETVWGRRRYLPGIYEKNKVLYEQARRMAINTVAQGTAAEIMKKGMIDLNAVLLRDFPHARLVLQIHDELLISVPENQALQLEAITKSVLENVVTWTVPLQVNTTIGANWKEVSK